MRTRVRFFLVSGYFAILLTGMFKIDLRSLGKWGSTIDNFGKVSGARGGFGFFSPNVGDQFVVRFIMSRKDGADQKVALEDGIPAEAAIRVGNMYRLWAQSLNQKDVRRSLAASLTTNLFEHFPEATAITFEADLYRFPPLNEYRQGKRPTQVPVYRAKFERKKNHVERKSL